MSSTDQTPEPSGSVGVVLRKWQREEIFDLVEAAGLDPAAFALDEDDGENRLRHLLAASYFTTRRAADGTYTVRYVAGDGPLEDRDGLSWYRLKQRVEGWLREVRTDLEMPDRWAELKQLAGVLAAAQSDGASNEPFTPGEQAEISTRLDATKDLVRRQFELTPEQVTRIEQKLDDLKEASTRLGRKDFVMLALGTVVSLFLTDTVPPHVLQAVLAAIIHGLGHVLGFGGPPPIITA